MAMFGSGLSPTGLFGGGTGGRPDKWMELLGILGATLQDAGAGYDGRQGGALARTQNNMQRLGDQKKYQEMLGQVSAPGTASVTNPTLTPGPQAPGNLPQLGPNREIMPREIAPPPLQVTDPGSMNSTAPGPLAGSQFAQMLPLLQNMDPERGMGLAFSAMQGEQQAQREDQRYQQGRTDQSRRPATAEEKRDYGLDPMTPAEIDGRGNITPISDPRAITPYQQKSLDNDVAGRKLQWANFNETVRNHKADEEAKRNPFGIGGNDKTGDEYLKGLPTGVASQVKAIANYRQAPPANRTTAAGLAIMNAVNQFNPSYDASQYGAKTKARNDFTTGKTGNTVRSLNVAVQHLEQLGQLSSALGNGDVQQFNRLGQTIAQQSGKAAPTNFDATKKIVADEIVKAVVGTGGGVYDREEVAKTINRASSPQQLAGVIQQFQGLLGGQLVGMKRQYEKSTGLTDFDEYLDPLTRTKLEHGAQNTGETKQIGGKSYVRRDGKWYEQ